jgi:hypothetical protein
LTLRQMRQSTKNERYRLLRMAGTFIAQFQARSGSHPLF